MSASLDELKHVMSRELARQLAMAMHHGGPVLDMDQLAHVVVRVYGGYRTKARNKGRCQHCGAPLLHHRRGTKFCSHVCRSQAHRAAKTEGTK
jgi:ferredoxin